MSESNLRLAIVGSSPVKLWGMTSQERIGRMARAEGMTTVADADAAELIANAGFAFDPVWLRHLADSPGTVLTCEGRPVLAHVAAPRAGIGKAIADGAALPGLTSLRAEDSGPLLDPKLRKRERPFVLPLRADTVAAAERASYVGAYKGVTDLLTKYLWPEWAFALTRIAARIGLTPNMVTGIGLILCIAATWAFAVGHYWPGLAMGLLFMVLDTVDGKLARCTITSSWWGNVFDHGIDLVHPPFWWWAWGMGLAAYGTPLAHDTIVAAFVAIMVAYVVQRLIEGAFIRAFAMHIHVWRRIDSQFRLITARRNPNMLILFVALCAGRPDLGLIALAGWSVLSCLFHVVRLAQAYGARASGRAITSWLAAD